MGLDFGILFEWSRFYVIFQVFKLNNTLILLKKLPKEDISEFLSLLSIECWKYYHGLFSKDTSRLMLKRP